MKWLIWSPALVTIFAAFVIPGGLLIFGLPLLALGYFVVVLITLDGNPEQRADTPARAVREQPTPVSRLPAERSAREQSAGPRRARLALRPGRTAERRTA